MLWAFVGLAPFAGHAAVWEARGEWTEDTEQRFGEWVRDHFVATLFHSDSPYADIATDCADSVYGMRMIFAYEQRLPFAIRDPGQPGRMITEQTRRFDRVPAGLPRFRAFLDWVMGVTSTASLVEDTYPVAIDRDTLRPGVIYLSWRTHAMAVVEVRPTGVIVYSESTTPRAIREMTEIAGFPFHVPADPRARRNGDGFRRFKRPQDYGRPDNELPGYGTEQFDQARAHGREVLPFYEWMRERLATAEEAPWQRVRRNLFTLCQLAWDRASAVDEAQQALADARRAGRRCLSAGEYDEHSTPIRDEALRKAFAHLVGLVREPWWPNLGTRYRDFTDLIAGRLPPAQADAIRPALLGWCDVNATAGGPGRAMDLAELGGQVLAGRLESDPHATPARRWGLDDAGADARFAACRRPAQVR